MCGASLPAASADVLAQNRRVSTPFMIEKTQRDAGRAWDKFYKANEDRFFKNRHWTDREFEAVSYTHLTLPTSDLV